MSARTILTQIRQNAFPILLLAATVAALIFFREPIIAWFTGERVGPEATGEPVAARAGDFQIGATLEPDPPRQKGNLLRLMVQDPSGDPVEGADVTVTYSMPAMGAMPEMRGEAEVEPRGDGRYDASFDLPMGGSWSLEVAVEKDEAAGEATFGMTIGSRGLTATGASAAAAPAGPPAPEIPPQQFDPATLERLRAAFEAYDGARALLARDAMEGLEAQALAARAALRAAAEALGDAEGEVSRCIEEASVAAERLGSSASVEEARRRFGDLGLFLVALASADPRLAEGWNIFSCPMAEGFPKWFQRSRRLENPYMGQRMLECGVRSDWTVVPRRSEGAGSGAGEIAHYTCSMHPSVKRQGKSTCPICAMDLTPVTKEEVETGTIFVDEVRRQRIGVRTAPAEPRELTLHIRSVGKVEYDETRLVDVNPRFSGWIEDLLVEETGQLVERGQTLFTIYSPELYQAQLEHLNSLRAEAQGRSETFPDLATASRQRLRLLGMTSEQVRELEEGGGIRDKVPVLAPQGGYVIEKNVVEGARVEAGMRVYRIADLSRVWIDAEVYESDLPHIRVGQPALVELPYVPGRTFEGRVDYEYPTLQAETRTGRIRIALENPDLELKPGMYANVRIDIDVGERLAVPDSAVIYTGPRRLVFLDLGEGRLRPKEVKLGVHVDGYYEVTDGLEAGDVVVTSGNFLIAAESRIRSAAKYWEGTGETD